MTLLIFDTGGTTVSEGTATFEHMVGRYTSFNVMDLTVSDDWPSKASLALDLLMEADFFLPLPCLRWEKHMPIILLFKGGSSVVGERAL